MDLADAILLIDNQLHDISLVTVIPLLWQGQHNSKVRNNHSNNLEKKQKQKQKNKKSDKDI